MGPRPFRAFFKLNQTDATTWQESGFACRVSGIVFRKFIIAWRGRGRGIFLFQNRDWRRDFQLPAFQQTCKTNCESEFERVDQVIAQNFFGGLLRVEIVSGFDQKSAARAG